MWWGLSSFALSSITVRFVYFHSPAALWNASSSAQPQYVYEPLGIDSKLKAYAPLWQDLNSITICEYEHYEMLDFLSLKFPERCHSL